MDRVYDLLQWENKRVQNQVQDLTMEFTSTVKFITPPTT